jgi:hypothetical protein
MSNHIGLYFPFIHFRDEAWLKLSALYWDKIARIVPPGFEMHDSDAVKQLSGELDFIISHFPTSQVVHLGTAFEKFVTKRQKELRQVYDVSQVENWSVNASNSARMPDYADRRYAYIFSVKIPQSLIDVMVDAKLAIRGGTREPYWIGMHPRLAAVYMTALAELFSRENNFTPLTPDADSYLAIGGCTLRRLERALLSQTAQAPNNPDVDEVASAMAMISLRSLIPTDLANLPPKKIIAFRKQFREELSSFQNWMHALGAKMADKLVDIRDPAARESHLQAFTEKKIVPKVAELRHQLESCGIKTMFGVLGLKFSVPPLFHLLNRSPSVIAKTTAMAVAVVPYLSARRAVGKKLLSKSPEAFLMYAEEQMSRQTIAQKLRKLCFRGVIGA